MSEAREDRLKGVESRAPKAGGGSAPSIRLGNLEVRPSEFQLCAHGSSVGLTPREFQVFSILLDRCDAVVNRPTIYAEVWGDAMAMRPRDRSVDVLVRRIRAKLAVADPEWSYIHTHFAVGYRLFPTPGRRATEDPVPPGRAELPRASPTRPRPPFSRLAAP